MLKGAKKEENSSSTIKQSVENYWSKWPLVWGQARRLRTKSTSTAVWPHRGSENFWTAQPIIQKALPADATADPCPIFVLSTYCPLPPRRRKKGKKKTVKVREWLTYVAVLQRRVHALRNMSPSANEGLSLPQLFLLC